MKKLKLMNLFLIVCLILSLLYGCTTTNQENSNFVSTEGAPAYGKKKVGLILGTGGSDDRSINAQAYEGLKNAERIFSNIEVYVFELNDMSMSENIQRNLIEERFNLIILISYDHFDALQKVADDAPYVTFSIIDAVIVDKPNVASVIYAAKEGSFLSGAVAALKSETQNVGFIGGLDSPDIRMWADGFVEGAKYINPDIQVITEYIGSDSDAYKNPALAKSMTIDLANQNVDIVFHAAGGSGIGVINGAKEAGIMAIGCAVDQHYLAPETVVTSVLQRQDVAVFEVVSRYLSTNLPRVLEMNLENNGMSIVFENHLTEDEIKIIEEIKQDIINGNIIITE